MRWKDFKGGVGEKKSIEQKRQYNNNNGPVMLVRFNTNIYLRMS